MFINFKLSNVFNIGPFCDLCSICRLICLFTKLPSFIQLTKTWTHASPRQHYQCMSKTRDDDATYSVFIMPVGGIINISREKFSSKLRIEP